MANTCMKVRTLDSLFYDKLGMILRNERQKRGITLFKLSKMTGISRVQLEYYELAYTRMKKENWQKICDALCINPNVKLSLNLEE